MKYGTEVEEKEKVEKKDLGKVLLMSDGDAKTLEHLGVIEKIQAQQTTPTPALGTNAFIVVGYSGGVYRVLNLDYILEIARQTEGLYTLDRLDTRNGITATIPIASVVGTVVRTSLPVPAGEVWELSRIQHIAPGESAPAVGDIVQTNFRVSIWPDTASDPDGKLYNAANIGVAAPTTTNEDLPAVSELGSVLRLEGGQKVTLVATLTGAAAGAAIVATLNPFGRKLKKIV